PKVMARKIDAAADHGIDAFIFDWYWYNGPFLQGGLDEGFLGADNNDRLKFALMWANHDWMEIFPRTLDHDPELLYPGAVTSSTFEALTDHIIDKYFSHPSYWKIEGRPYFSIYDLSAFLDGLGGIEGARQALDRFREKTKSAGFPDLHLNIVMWGRTILPNEKVVEDPAALIHELGFDSVTSYVWVHHVPLNEFPLTPYRTVFEKYMDYCHRAGTKYDLPYYPNATVGWDSSPRTDQEGQFINAGYPYTPIMSGSTPEAFEESLFALRDYLETQPRDQRILTVNSWNEWTEGSYLEPDTRHGMKYLEAIQTVFKELAYRDGRPTAKWRMEAKDQGVVLRHGDGPNQCDIYGARDVWVFESEGKYYLHYDAAGPTGWLCSLAVSDDLV
ncbi:MAG: glycoside hydrolase family 99-like domain-containing protein, partial [Candidatus Omnitrophica bacterium]|nr:glycoside hydrolase family 99-like domain-containing protein [Candidatus Omnitrophota bacterium]